MNKILFALCIAALLGAASSAGSQQSATVESERKAEGEIRVPSRFDGVLIELEAAVQPGHKVQKGQVLARLDERLAQNRFHIAEAKLRVAQADRDAARHVTGETEIRMKAYAQREKVKDFSEMDARASRLLHETKLAELRSKEELLKIAELEREQAKLHLDLHQIRSPVSGVVKQVLQRPGEAVRSLETVVVVDSSKGG